MEYDAFADALVAGAKTYIDGQFSAILQRLAILEARSVPEPSVGIQSALRANGGELVFVLTDGRTLNVGPIDGKDAPPIDMTQLMQQIVATVDLVVDQLPPPKPGKDAPPVAAADVAALIKAEVEPILREVALAAVAALPKAADGAPGADADMGEVERLIGAEVTRQVAALPPPEDIKPIVIRSILAALPPGPAGKDADPEVIARMVEQAVAALPPPADYIEPMVARSVSKAVADLPPGPAGKDADPEVIAHMVERAVAALPPPADGHTPTEEDLQPIVARSVEAAIAALPPPAPGKDADPALTAQMVMAAVTRAVDALPPPADGRTPTEADIEPIVARSVETAVAALPPAAAGKDADPEVTARLVAAEVGKAVAALPPPADGKSVTIDELVPVIERCAAALPRAKDGVGLTGALIDRQGRLVLTLADGTLRDLGVVLGKDADMEALAAICVAEVAKIPRPRDGADGLGFDDFQVIHDGERQVTLRFMRGETVKDFTLTIPAIIDRGIWREGKYSKGDGVTWDGSFFIAQCDTSEKPLLHQDWRQAVKAGRPGKNTETVKYLPATVKLDAKSADAAAP